MTNHKVEGLPLEIKFLRETITFLLHPDGVLYSDSIAILTRHEAMQRAVKHLKKVNDILYAGTIDADEYDEQLADLDRQKDVLLQSLSKRKAKGEFTDKEYADAIGSVEREYRAACKSLLNARDGVPCSPDENEKLEKEFDYWREKANIRPLAVPFLRSALVGWIRNGAEGPVTIDDLNELTEDQLKIAFSKVKEFYEEREKQEKKPIETRTDSSQTPKQELENSLMTSGYSGSAEPTELTPTSSGTNGESAKLVAQ